MHLVQFTDRELAICIAALRYYAHETAEDRTKGQSRQARRRIRLDVLGGIPAPPEVIDALCEKLLAGPLDVQPPKAGRKRRPDSIWVVIHGEAFIPEAFRERAQAESFLAARKDAVSGPWEIYTGA